MDIFVVAKIDLATNLIIDWQPGPSDATACTIKAIDLNMQIPKGENKFEWRAYKCDQSTPNQTATTGETQ